MTKTEKAISYMESIARDDSHGYDQIHRTGPGDYDCSGLVISAWKQAGVNTGATYTGDMYRAFLKAGFKDITRQVNFSSGYGLKRGDVLLSPGHHTAMYCGSGKMVDARINEKGRSTGGKPGDQTGHEIEIHRYNDHPWKYALRYPEATPEKVPETRQEDGTNATVRTNGGVLNFRKHPSTDAEKLNSIPEIRNGERVKVIRSAKAAGWLFIRYNGRYGYVYDKYIERD